MTDATYAPPVPHNSLEIPPRPLDPLGGAVVDRSAVTFQWEAVAGAGGYRLQIAPDRQFARGVAEFETGPSTDFTLVNSLPVSEAPIFWRVRAEAGSSASRWSPYGRFFPSSDDAADLYRAQRDAERDAARKEHLRRKAEEGRARDLIPQWQRDDTNPTGAEVASIGITMLGSFVLLVLLLLLL